MAKSKTNRVVVSKGDTASGPGRRTFQVDAPEGYRVVSAFISDVDIWTATPLSNSHPYVDAVQFNYETVGPGTFTGVVITERADEPDIFVTQ